MSYPPQITLVVCGSLPQTEGCYGSASIGPFGRVGAMIEGSPVQNVKKGTVTRFIYVVDVAAGSGANQVVLYIYKKVDTINQSDDSISVTLFNTVNLPLTGGAATVAYMAANPTFLYIGTNQDESAVQVTKKTLALSQIGEFSGLNIGAITADAYGYVTLNVGNHGWRQWVSGSSTKRRRRGRRRRSPGDVEHHAGNVAARSSVDPQGVFTTGNWLLRTEN